MSRIRQALLGALVASLVTVAVTAAKSYDAQPLTRDTSAWVVTIATHADEGENGEPAIYTGVFFPAADACQSALQYDEDLKNDLMVYMFGKMVQHHGDVTFDGPTCMKLADLVGNPA